MKKPKRREAVYTLKEIADAWEGAGQLFPFYGSHVHTLLRRIAARKRKK